MAVTAGRLVTFTALALIAIAGFSLYRTFVVFKAPPPEPECQASLSHQPITDTNSLIARFSRAIQFRTVTRGVGQVNEVELLRFIDWLQSGN